MYSRLFKGPLSPWALVISIGFTPSPTPPVSVPLLVSIFTARVDTKRRTGLLQSFVCLSLT